MTWQVLCADVIDGLASLPDASVQTAVTSPPYWGLRDYGNDGQLGLEPTPEAYVERMVEVFRAVRRVLRDDGTVWLNLGDSYASNQGEQVPDTKNPRAMARRVAVRSAAIKAKDLVGIPWMVAFALRVDGWYLRSDIIWAKPNPMPESVTDRPTKSHEYVFLLSKSARYFYDADAVREPHLTADRAGYRESYAPGSASSMLNGVHEAKGGAFVGLPLNDAGRNMRSVWNIATEPFPGAHFATFPKKLVEPCVKAGSATGDTVLDPFCGSGTVGVVAARLGRSFVGIELNPAYAEMARDRIRNDAPLWNHAAELSVAHTEESG